MLFQSMAVFLTKLTNAIPKHGSIFNQYSGLKVLNLSRAILFFL